jgi:hypothetical protein
VVRVERSEQPDPAVVAFTAGVYDSDARRERASIPPRISDLKEGYASYLLGEVETNKDQYLWVASAANTSVRAVWVARVYLVPDRD